MMQMHLSVPADVSRHLQEHDLCSVRRSKRDKTLHRKTKVLLAVSAPGFAYPAHD